MMIEEYVTVRRALGFTLARERHLLLDFVEFLDDRHAGAITSALALEWATLPQAASPLWWSERLSKVRAFARYAQAVDPANEVPPIDLLPRVPTSHRRAEPYLYTDDEIASLLAAARRMRTKAAAPTCETLIGLLVVTGMRVGEVIALDCGDVDLDHGVITVRHAKFDRARQVPLHASAVKALKDYADWRDRRWPHPKSPSFFVASQGGRPTYSVVSSQFRGLVRVAGLPPRSPRCRPRIHDLRHLFACRALEGWYRSGVDVEARLPVLSTFLGHAGPKATYWYLSARPELLELAAGRLEASLGERS
jgi:integrase/recombinase XerD